MDQSLMTSLEVLKNVLSQTNSSIENLIKVHGELAEGRSLNAESSSKICELVNRVNTSSVEWLALMEECAAVATSAPEIPWLGDERTKQDMTYIEGDNPWEFSLAYSVKDKLNEITEKLKTLYGLNNLRRFVNPPKENELVVCQVGKNFFRARITKSFPNGRVKVSKIDYNEEIVLQATNLYQVPNEVAAIPCQSVRCCLNKEDQNLEEKWIKELALIFKKTLTECQLTVDILEKLDCSFPPKYLVRIYVFNEDIQVEMNLNTWINDKLLPDLKSVKLSDGEDAIGLLDEQCLDPFLFCRVKESPNSVPDENPYDPVATSKSLSTDPNDDQENLDVPDPHIIGLSVAKVSTWMHQYSDEKTIKLNRKTKPIDVPKVEEPSFEFARSKKLVASDVPKNLELSIEAQEFTPSSEHPSTSSNEQLGTSSAAVGSKMSPAATEFIPSCFVEINPGDNEESLENVISNLEDEYQPKDEKRVCLFFQRRGFCRRKACDKLHIKPTDKWTDDVAEIDKGPFNNIDLPREGSITFLQVQHVENATTFYSTINDIYSGVQEFGMQETLESLVQDLNSNDITTSPHPLLDTSPEISEMVLALGLQRTLGPRKKWLRAIVTEIFDSCTMEVFFSDFGNTEIVSVKDIRKIRPQFLHLPAQAVRTTLSMIQVVPEQRSKGKSFLEKLIKGKLVKAEVVGRDIINAELDVVLFDENDHSINNLMAVEGFCLPY